jgi:hypothetical protein
MVTPARCLVGGPSHHALLSLAFLAKALETPKSETTIDVDELMNGSLRLSHEQHDLARRVQNRFAHGEKRRKADADVPTTQTCEDE